MHTRQTLSALAALLGLAATPAMAQPAASGDVAAGYSTVNILANAGTAAESVTLPLGWVVSVSTTVGPVASLVGEVGGSYKSQRVQGTEVDTSIYSFAGGVRVGRGVACARPFAQFLIGSARSSIRISGVGDINTTGLVVLPGVGVDVPFSERVAFRTQADFTVFRADGVTDRGFRFAFSAVLRF